MSNTQYAFLNRQDVPSREALQREIDALDFPLQLDPDFTPFEDNGFSPCILGGKEGMGFEIWYEPAPDLIEGDESLESISAGKDYCISLTWHSSDDDLACAMIVSAVLAAKFGAIVSYEGDDPESAEWLIAEARSLLAPADADVSSPPKPSPQRDSAEAVMTITVGNKTFERTYANGVRKDGD